MWQDDDNEIKNEGTNESVNTVEEAETLLEEMKNPRESETIEDFSLALENLTLSYETDEEALLNQLNSVEDVNQLVQNHRLPVKLFDELRLKEETKAKDCKAKLTMIHDYLHAQFNEINYRPNTPAPTGFFGGLQLNTKYLYSLETELVKKLSCDAQAKYHAKNLIDEMPLEQLEALENKIIECLEEGTTNPNFNYEEALAELNRQCESSKAISPLLEEAKKLHNMTSSKQPSAKSESLSKLSERKQKLLEEFAIPTYFGPSLMAAKKKQALRVAEEAEYSERKIQRIVTK